MTLPSDLPAADEVLTVTSYSGGAGVLEWAAAGGGAVSAVANGSDNRIATFSSTTALNGEANLTYTGNYLSLQGAADDATSSGIHWGTSADTTLGTLEYDTVEGRFQLMVNNTASVLRIDNTTLFLDRGQIKWPATQNASSDANTLDDYEEGTWTPALKFGGGSTSLTYDNGGQTGIYTKVGNTVFFQAYIGLTSNGSSTGNAAIEGLPFAIGSPLAGVTMTIREGYSFADYPNGLIVGSLIELGETNNAGTYSRTTQANIPDSVQIFISGFYRV